MADSRIFVGNIPFHAEEEDIRELFPTARSVRLIRDRESGKSKGFAFVEMQTEEEAQEAIRRDGGYTIGGRTLRVNEALSRDTRPSYPPTTAYRQPAFENGGHGGSRGSDGKRPKKGKSRRRRDDAWG